MEWVDPRYRNVNKPPFLSPLTFFLKHDQRTCNWIGNSKLKPIYANESTKRKQFNEIKIPKQKDEDKSDNKKDTEKYCSVSATVVTSQEKVDMKNKHIVIPMKTEKKEKNPWKTIHELVYGKYLKKSKIFTDKFLQMCNTKTNEPQNIKNQSDNNIKNTAFE